MLLLWSAKLQTVGQLHFSQGLHTTMCEKTPSGRVFPLMWQLSVARATKNRKMSLRPFKSAQVTWLWHSLHQKELSSWEIFSQCFRNWILYNWQTESDMVHSAPVVASAMGKHWMMMSAIAQWACVSGVPVDLHNMADPGDPVWVTVVGSKKLLLPWPNMDHTLSLFPGTTPHPPVFTFPWMLSQRGNGPKLINVDVQYSPVPKQKQLCFRMEVTSHRFMLFWLSTKTFATFSFLQWSQSQILASGLCFLTNIDQLPPLVFSSTERSSS